ncbi:MAG: hypothetical protein EU539_08885 [Promethearchaeota archaeon]|nr:MAG: hypothetical protein EU539_08885 [Candidatus Lokiarchaeota archaeon]
MEKNANNEKDNKINNSEIDKLTMELDNTKDEKERRKKIRLLERIDNMRVIQNNHFMIGKFDEAIELAKDIIQVAQDAKLYSIVKEQEQFIDQVKLKIVEKNKISIILDAFKIIREEYESLLKKKEIIKAHELIKDFKEKYGQNYELPSHPQIRELLIKDRELWIEFLEDQEKLTKKLDSISNNFQKFLKKNDLDTANEILIKAEPLLENVLDPEIKAQWESYQQMHAEQKENNEICERVDETIEESLALKDKFIFEEAILKIDTIDKEIKDKELPRCKTKLSETREEIIAAEIKYNKLYLELAKFKDEFRFNRQNDFLRAAVRVCEKIIDVSQLIGMKEVEKEYANKLAGLEKEIKEKEIALRKQQEELKNKLKEIRNLLEIDENVLPLLEEFSVKDILGTLSENQKEKFEQLGTLLIENRVNIKNEVINNVLLKTTSEEIIESSIPREILLLEGEGLPYNVKSGMTNRFDDVIEEATITDLIPYNFEIISIKKNEHPVNTLPEKILKKEGIELKWQVRNLKPKERIDISYDLRRRISRTIIFVVGDELNILKTHQNLKEVNIQGLYEAMLSFKNIHGNKLSGLIFEDIIPPHYIHFIKEPKGLEPIKTKIKMGESFRWDIGTMEEDKVIFHYKLLEKPQFKKHKSQIDDLSKHGFESLKKGNFIEALDSYKQIKDIITSKVLKK